MFRGMPFVLQLLIFGIWCLEPFVPLAGKEFFYAVSMSLKSLIIFALPFLIFTLLFKTAMTLSKGATALMALILVLVCISNFLSTFLSHYVGMWIYGFEISMMKPHAVHVLKPLWSLEIPCFLGNREALFAGIVSGIITAKCLPEKTEILGKVIEKILEKAFAGFAYCIPMFVVGFVLKMSYEGVIALFIDHYSFIFLLIAFSQFGYILLGYGVLNGFSGRRFWENLKNIFPGALSGFTTMSSAASMPLVIVGVEKNCRHRDLARAVIPATVNIHLIGDCFAIPILAYAILKTFGMPEPSLMTYLLFSFYFVMAKFSVAAIPGGGIIVMLPILETYLGFNAEMLSLITALYILFDPVITAANIFGNGAFAKGVDTLLNLFSKKLQGGTSQH